VPRVPCLIHPTNHFDDDVTLIREMLGAAADGVLLKLALAVKALADYEWDGSLPLEPHGWVGDSFAYPFAPGFALVFRRATDRDETKRPVRIHLYLKSVMGV
jgi:hypothetical protein